MAGVIPQSGIPAPGQAGEEKLLSRYPERLWISSAHHLQLGQGAALRSPPLQTAHRAGDPPDLPRRRFFHSHVLNPTWKQQIHTPAATWYGDITACKDSGDTYKTKKNHSPLHLYPWRPSSHGPGPQQQAGSVALPRRALRPGTGWQEKEGQETPRQKRFLGLGVTPAADKSTGWGQPKPRWLFPGKVLGSEGKASGIKGLGSNGLF